MAMPEGLRAHLIGLVEAARLLGVSRKVLLRVKELPKIRIGHRIYVPKKDFLRLYGEQLERYGVTRAASESDGS